MESIDYKMIVNIKSQVLHLTVAAFCKIHNKLSTMNQPMYPKTIPKVQGFIDLQLNSPFQKPGCSAIFFWEKKKR